MIFTYSILIDNASRSYSFFNFWKISINHSQQTVLQQGETYVPHFQNCFFFLTPSSILSEFRLTTTSSTAAAHRWQCNNQMLHEANIGCKCAIFVLNYKNKLGNISDANQHLRANYRNFNLSHQINIQGEGRREVGGGFTKV